MRSHFDEQLNTLNDEMILMGSMIEEAIDTACQLMSTRDKAVARRVMEQDAAVDRKERDIEALCLKLILMQQPVARDLRLVSSALKMITDMERIGDQAADIAEIVTMPYKGDRYDYPKDLSRMGKAAGGMVHDVIDAFVRRDLDLARAVIEKDDVVDGFFSSVRNGLLQDIKKKSEAGGQLLDALMIAKYFERIGDHAVNIAHWVEYAVSGIYRGERLQ